jgi:hypothetical protein
MSWFPRRPPAFPVRQAKREPEPRQRTKNESRCLMHGAGYDSMGVAHGGPQDALCFSRIRRAGDVVEGSGAKHGEVMIPFGETRQNDNWCGSRCCDDATEIAIRQRFMAENHAKLLFVHEGSCFVEFHAADGDQPASSHRRGYFFMMFFFGRDYQYLVDSGHIFTFLGLRRKRPQFVGPSAVSFS